MSSTGIIGYQVAHILPCLTIVCGNSHPDHYAVGLHSDELHAFGDYLKGATGPESGS